MLETLRITIDFGLVVLIWLVQLVIYPSFQYCAREHLCDWHARYTRRIGYIVMPLMLAQVGIVGIQAYKAINVPILISACLVAIVWISTFVQAVPLHAQIAAETHAEAAISRLIAVNWTRTVLWTCIFVLGILPL